MSEEPRPPPKKDIANELLRGPSLFVHLDPRRPGVIVPKSFTGQPQLVLQVGLNMVIPIPDLKVDDDGISCTLSFNRVPIFCRLPWSSIYALVGENGMGMVWQDDVPPEVAAQMSRSQKAQQQRKPKGKLAAVADESKPAPRKAREDAKTDGVAGIGDGSRREAKRPLEALSPPKPPESAPKRADIAPPPSSQGGSPKRAEPRGDEPRDTPSSSPEPSPPPSGGKKPRRELPPYLRVIK